MVLLNAGAASAAVRVYAKVQSDTAIYPGDQFVYSVVVEGGQPSKVDVSALAPFNPQSAGHQTSMNMINSSMTVSYAENYAVTAAQAGVMRLPGVTVVVDGKTYTTDPVEVTISPPGKTDQMTLDFTLSEKRCYVGQPLLMTVKWTIRGQWEGGGIDAPVFGSDAFYFEDAAERANAQALQPLAFHGVQVMIGRERRLVRGMQADCLSFRKILIPKQAGHLRLDPICASTSLAVGRERVDGFFGPSYQLKYQRVSVQSNPVELDVLPLPETGKPPQFYGLVGQYTIAASATPTKVNVGDPITLTIRIGGNPYLKPVQWPALEQVPELAANFKIPAEKAAPTLENGGKVFTQTLRANSDKVTQIPPIPLVYFDSARGAYVTAQTEPIKLDVAPSKVLTNIDVQGTAVAPPVNREVETIRKGLSANYYGPDVLENQSLSVLSLLAHPGYAALWSIPLLVLLASTVIKVAGRTSPESVARKRRRRAAGVALAQLKDVSAAQPEQKHEVLLAAMKGYLGDRFDKVAASLTAEDCRRVIEDATGDAAAAARCGELIDACEAARYAPLQAKIGPDQVQAAIELIQGVEQAKPAVPKSHSSHGAYRSYLLLLAFCLVLAPATRAAPALPRDQLGVLLQEANTAFQNANAAHNPETARPLYDKAILLYEKIIDQGGVHNAKLYYNLANAYLLKQDLGRAILNYRRAAKLDHGDLNIQKNLSFARSRRVDRVETSAERRVLGTLFFWHYDFSLRTKFLLTTVFFAALCVTLTVIVWRGRGSATVVTAVLSGVLLVCFLTSILVATRQEAATHWGVVTAAEVVARQGDGPNYPPSFKDPLHAGMEFELLEHRPGWLHIELSNGTDAWIPADTAGLV